MFTILGETGQFTVFRVNENNLSSRNCVYHFYKSVLFSKEWPRRSGTGIKDDFEEMEHEFSFATLCPEKREYLFRSVPLLPEIFGRNDPKSCVPFSFEPDFP